MKKEYYRTLQILNRDKMMDTEGLSALVSNEVADRLSNFLSIEDILSRVKVTDNNKLEIVIAIKCNNYK